LQQLVPDFQDLKICSNEVGYVLNNQSPNGVTGTWSPSTIDFTTGGSYTFTPNAGQCASPQTISVTIISSSSADFQWIASEPFSTNLTITITANIPGNYLYQLDFGPKQTSNVFENVASGFHTVQVTTADGCFRPVTIDSILIINYPKYFTPNDDGQNDTWNINDLFLQKNSKIYIYDRYGKLLKQIFPVQGGWDGKYNNNIMPASDYWFIVEFEYNNAIKTYKAHFALKR
jgi:gliding motility-associated-like protein